MATGAFPLWWGLLAASLCALAAKLVMRHTVSRLIGPATTPAMKRARKKLIRRVLAGDEELEAQLDACLRELRSEEASRGEAPGARGFDA